MNLNYSDIAARLKIHCEQCSGLCCVALYCMKTDGFPANKDAGIPCRHLMTDFRCDTHSTLASKQLKGCMAYDCFGAGQKVTQECYFDVDWKSAPEKASEIFNVFRVVFQLHQMEWYLLEANSLTTDTHTKEKIETLISENEQITSKSPIEILNFGIEDYQVRVNKILKQICDTTSKPSSNGKHSKDSFGRDFKRANLDGVDFSMAFLIAANLEGCSLHGTNFLGADMRDANVKNTDLSSCLFLTQMQINSSKGNASTKLPSKLSHPASWTNTDARP